VPVRGGFSVRDREMGVGWPGAFKKAFCDKRRGGGNLGEKGFANRLFPKGPRLFEH